MSRHQPRQKLALEYGATDIVDERSDEGVAKIKDLTDGLGAHSVVEAVGTQQSLMQAIRSTRPGGHLGFVGVLHGVELPGEELFWSHVHVHGGPAPVRRFLTELVDLIWNRPAPATRHSVCCVTSPKKTQSPPWSTVRSPRSAG
jgi:threonine dehydrogenase-like Zn-dependent dehydrogenase